MANIKKFKFYCRHKEIEIAKQYNYLGFTFTPPVEKQGKKVWWTRKEKCGFLYKKCYYVTYIKKKKQSTFV